MKRLWSRWRLNSLLLNSICFFAVLPAPGAEVRLLFSEPAMEAVAGAEISLSLHALNTTTRDRNWTFPRTISCRFIISNLTNQASLEAEQPAGSPEVTIAPGRFEVRTYRVRVPVSMHGSVWLECADLNVNRVALQVRPPAKEIATAEPESKSRLRKFLQAEPLRLGETFNAGRFFKEHVSSYEPLYFIAGTESPNAKFQVSFKYRLLNNDGPLATNWPALRGFHVAYTQTSLWDWNSASAPFFDSSYRPEVLYLAENVTRAKSNDWFRLDLQAGFQHESNGRDGFDSRSLNIAYLRPRFVFGKEDRLQLILQPRAWTYIGDLSDNPDIADYRGYVDVRAIVGWQRGPQLSATGRLGKDGDHESLQLDFTYPLMGFFPRSFSLYLHVQYYTGFGESLLRYNERDTSLRAGFSLTR
jgi:phospholipase A1/A2